MNKLFIISYFFPPLVDVGSLRALGYYIHLPELGWEPYVLTVKNPDRSLCKIDHNTFYEKNVYFVRSLFNINRLLWKVNGLAKKIFKYIKLDIKDNFFHDLLCYPDVFLGWLIPSFLKGLYLAWKKDVNLIYVSCKPFSSAVSGVLIKKISKKPLVLDFRDPISFPSSQFGSGKLARFRKKNMKAIEKYVLKHCDKLIVTTDGIKNEYLSIYPFLKDKIHRIYNGYYMFNSALFTSSQFSKFTITYCGNFYENEIPAENFFRAFSKIINKKILPSEKVQFMYVGHLRKNGNWLDSIAEKYKFQDNLVTVGEVTREESLRIISKSALLLLRIIPPMISTKLFEGLSLGVPILATINSTEAESLIKTYSSNSFVMGPNNTKEIANAIKDAYVKWSINELSTNVNESYQKKFNKKYLTTKFADIIGEFTLPKNERSMIYGKQ